MIRIREFLATPEVFLSPEVQALRAHLFRFFACLYFTTDGAGRFVADAVQLRGVLFAHTLQQVSKQDVQAWLVELHARGLVRLYTEEGVGFGKIPEKYWQQRDKNRKAIHPKETPPEPGELFTGESPPGLKDEVAAPPSEWNRREENPPTPAASGAGGEREVLYFSQRLFNTMAELEGSPIDKLTKAGRRSITGALSAIRLVKPDLHPADLEKAAAAWKKLFPTASLTARAMATHWAKLQGSPVARSAESLVEPEPLGWRDWINENTPEAKYARGGELEGTPWHDLDAAYRRYLITQCQRRDERGHAA